MWSGEFKGGALTGKGEYKGADGERYVGAFRNWRYQGEGTLTLADGSRYQGGFAGGRYSGEGTLALADGGQEKAPGAAAGACVTKPARHCPTRWKSACWNRAACSTPPSMRCPPPPRRWSCTP